LVLVILGGGADDLLSGGTAGLRGGARMGLHEGGGWDCTGRLEGYCPAGRWGVLRGGKARGFGLAGWRMAVIGWFLGCALGAQR
jgi:hypothetical protein